MTIEIKNLNKNYNNISAVKKINFTINKLNYHEINFFIKKLNFQTLLKAEYC